MTDQQLDAMIDRQIEAYESFLEEQFERDMLEREEEANAHQFYSESYSY